MKIFMKKKLFFSRDKIYNLNFTLRPPTFVRPLRLPDRLNFIIRFVAMFITQNFKVLLAQTPLGFSRTGHVRHIATATPKTTQHRTVILAFVTPISRTAPYGRIQANDSRTNQIDTVRPYSTIAMHPHLVRCVRCFGHAFEYVHHIGAGLRIGCQ